jgi:quercetin dioxygenase-like cupin family protein
MSNRAPIQPEELLANPVTGESFRFIETAATTNGRLLAFELGLRAGGGVPMPHVHPIQTERFQVLEGTVRFRIGRRTRLVAAGTVVEIAPGVLHGFSNPGPETVRMRVDVTPALQMEEMLREVVALAEAGRLTRRGLPRSPFELARLARAYQNVARAPFVPVAAQRALLWLLGRRETSMLRRPTSQSAGSLRSPTTTFASTSSSPVSARSATGPCISSTN